MSHEAFAFWYGVMVGVGGVLSLFTFLSWLFDCVADPTPPERPAWRVDDDTKA